MLASVTANLSLIIRGEIDGNLLFFDDEMAFFEGFHRIDLLRNFMFNFIYRPETARPQQLQNLEIRQSSNSFLHHRFRGDFHFFLCMQIVTVLSEPFVELFTIEIYLWVYGTLVIYL
jgi:hypothetical protein